MVVSVKYHKTLSIASSADLYIKIMLKKLKIKINLI